MNAPPVMDAGRPALRSSAACVWSALVLVCAASHAATTFATAILSAPLRSSPTSSCNHARSAVEVSSMRAKVLQSTTSMAASAVWMSRRTRFSSNTAPGSGSRRLIALACSSSVMFLIGIASTETGLAHWRKERMLDSSQDVTKLHQPGMDTTRNPGLKKFSP